MHLAVLTPGVLPALPVGPIGLGPKLSPVLVITLPLDQVARGLPPLGCVIDRRPRRTRQLAQARGELQKRRRRAHFVLAGKRPDRTELLVDLRLGQENVALD